MRECIVESDNFVDAYHKALVALQTCGEVISCDDWSCNQLECSMTMVVGNPTSEPRISKLCICSPESLEQYRQEMLDGILDFNIGKTWQYTYHNRMVDWCGKDQVKFVIDELKRNPSSRRAVIDVRDNGCDMYSDDPACLQHIQYFIRDGKLDCKVLFRSNDATRATFMNGFALIELQSKIAKELGLEVGQYVHRANSFHCYQNEFETLGNYCKAILNRPIDKLSFNYKDNWEIKMYNSIEEINKKVENLKND